MNRSKQLTRWRHVGAAKHAGSCGEGPAPAGPGEVEPSQVSPDGPAAPSPAQAAAARVEQQRIAREKRAAEQQRIKDERQAVQLRKIAYDTVLRQFREARMDFWKNAPAEDRPGKVKEPLTFNCLVPETNSFAVLALLCKPDGPMVVQRLTSTADPIELPEADFKQLTAEAPFLVMREGRSYFCTPGKLSETTNAVPAYGESMNPSKETFGVLYDLVFKLRIKRPDFVWQVSFQPREFETSIAICTARFGETVTRNRVYPKVREAMRIYQENLARQKAMRSMRVGMRSIPPATVSRRAKRKRHAPSGSNSTMRLFARKTPNATPTGPWRPLRRASRSPARKSKTC